MSTELPEDQISATKQESKVSKNKKALVLGFGIFIAVAVILSLGVGVYRVFAKGATDGFSQAIASVLRLPAVKVNSETILYNDYMADLKAIKKVREYDIKNNTQNANSAAGLVDEELSDQVLIRMVYNILVKDLAQELNVKVEEADIKEVHDALLEQLGNDAAIEAELKERYGWNFDEYVARVIRPLLLQSKVAEVVSTDIPAREAIQKKAQGVLDEIKGGANFVELAAKYSEDSTSKTGGSLGEFGAGEMVPAFEDAVKKLKKGEFSKELVESQYGYHIIKLDDIHQKGEKIIASINESGKPVYQLDEKGKPLTYTETKYNASHILLMHPNINQKLSKLMKESNIHLYLNIHDPFKDLIKLTGQE